MIVICDGKNWPTYCVKRSLMAEQILNLAKFKYEMINYLGAEEFAFS